MEQTPQDSDDQALALSVVELVDAKGQSDDVLRAIGLYFVTFSQLLASMRSLMIERITAPGTERNLLVLALGSLQSQQIADPFFSICRHEADLDEADKRIEKVLEKQVKAEIEERNRIAHADWEVARWTRGDGSEGPVARRVRVKPGNKDEPIQQEHYNVGDIDRVCERAELLRNVVWEFGSICLHGGNYARWRGILPPKVSEALQVQDACVVYKIGDAEVPFPPL